MAQAQEALDEIAPDELIDGARIDVIWRQLSFFMTDAGVGAVSEELLFADGSGEEGSFPAP